MQHLSMSINRSVNQKAATYTMWPYNLRRETLLKLQNMTTDANVLWICCGLSMFVCGRLCNRLICCRASTRCTACLWLNGSVVSALGIRARGPRFDSRVAPLFHWVAALGKLFTRIASPVSQHKREFSAPKWLR